ncbi:MAG: universal stress protein [bacterium]|nr:universal stress protein [bacterium]
MKDADSLRQRLQEQKSAQLAQLAGPLRESGLEVTTKVLMGKSSLQLSREVLRNQHDLLIRFAKGIESGHKGFFGGTAQRLLRQCPCPVWLLTNDAKPGLKHIAASVNTSSDDPIDVELNQSILDTMCTLGEEFQSRQSVIHVWASWDEPLLRAHLSDRGFEALRASAERRNAKLLYDLTQRREDGGEIESHLLEGDTTEAIASFVAKQSVDLLVMGTVARSWLTGAVFGNTAERILSQLTCSILALKPNEFRTSVSLD